VEEPVARPPANTESYDRIVDNPYLPSARNPLSTFSLDVDTASYSNVRRFLLQEHRLPPPDAVRIADMVNYFPYTYPPPRDEHPVAFTLDLTQCPWKEGHLLARVAMQARLFDATKRPPRNLVFLVDTSGSMDEPNRLPLLKRSLEMLVGQLDEDDRVAIVTYAGNTGLVLPSIPGNLKGEILAALGRLDAGGSTNGGAGIALAYRIACKNYIRGGLNRVILGTDGDFNVGTTGADLVHLVEDQRRAGVYLTILGFGMGNLKYDIMEKLSQAGNGHHAYIDSEAEARKVFIEQGATLVTVAKDVKLQVEFNPQRVAGYRLVGYENRLLQAQDFNDDAKNAGAIGSGHTVTALYELVPAGRPVPAPGIDPLKYQEPATTTPAADSGEWLTVKLRYKDPEADTSGLHSQALAGPACRWEDAPADFRFAAAVAAFGMLLRNSEHRGDANYGLVGAWAAAAQGRDPNGHRQEFLSLVDEAARLTRAADADRRQ
jgi:Ca-activated chloride channel family protein